MADKKKLATAAVAVTAAAAILLGGTFAWQSISQTALNEASDIVNPGGRLHDDFDGTNKDVYVENFTDPENGGEDIYARIRLEEYFEIVMNYGTPAQSVETVVGSTVDLTDGTEATGNNIVKDAEDNPIYERVYAPKIIESVDENGVVHAAVVDGTYDVDADEGSTGYSWWNWQTGGETVYMPTFNLNKDSLAADINGTYVDAVGGISNRDGNQYENYETYEVDETKTGTEIYDGDSNSLDEVGTDVANAANYPDNVELVAGVEHTAKETTHIGELISMAEWLERREHGGDTSNCWVYDTDGWIYWAAPIPAGETTGLLLDGIGLNQVMDDTWYYAINVVAQFVTADDVGKTDNTGFYADADQVPTAEAEELLAAIGVDMSGEAGGTNEEFVPQPGTLTGSSMSLSTDSEYISVDEATNTLTVYPIGGWDAVEVTLEHETLTFHETEITAYRMEDGEYVETDTSYIDVVCYTVEGDDKVEINLSTEAVGQYKIEVSYNDGEDRFEGSIEFSIEAYDGPMNGDDEENGGNFLGSNILVNNQEPDENGYIYLSSLDIEKNNSFTVLVNEAAVTLAENGLTATFHEDNITNTTFVVDEGDPYSATLTIAAHDYHSVTITAKYDDGTEESVTVVPIYDTIIITPDMDGETLYLRSNQYTLVAEEFDDAVTWSLDGANRSQIYHPEDNLYSLVISSYESSTDVTLTATDGTESATVHITVVDNSPYDGPTYSYYIQGSGDPWSYPLMQNQDYFWNQSEEKSYELHIGMTNDFVTNGGQVNITLNGLQQNENGDFVAGFIGEDGTFRNTATGQSPAGILVTEAQTQPFTIQVDITGIDGERYETTEYYHKIFIYPVPEGISAIRFASVESDDVEYEWGDDEEEVAKEILYIAPGESAEASLFVNYLNGSEKPLTNEKLTWSLTANTDTFTIIPGDDALTATIIHNCEDADSCQCSSDTKVVVQINGMDYTFTSEFVIYPKANPNPDEGGENGELKVERDGNLTLNLTDIGSQFDCDETVTITIEGYDDMSLFDWEIEEGVGTYAVEGQPGVFIHYGADTEKYNACMCTTTIKATLKTDGSIWGSVSFECA